MSKSTPIAKKKTKKKTAKKTVKKTTKKKVSEEKLEMPTETAETVAETPKPNTISQEQSVDPPQPTPSLQGLQEPKTGLDPAGQEIVLLSDAIREYCNASGAVAIILKRMCDGCPEAFPNYQNWMSAKMGYDVSAIVAGKMQAVGWIERLLPALFVMLEDHIFNIRWTAQVAIALTFSVTAIELPMLLPIEVQRLVTSRMLELLRNNREVRDRMDPEQNEVPNIILPGG